MKARVKSDYRWSTARACSGVEFVKSEWRPVPTGFEIEAQRHPALDTDAGSDKHPAPKTESDTKTYVLASDGAEIIVAGEAEVKPVPKPEKIKRKAVKP